jgi:ATP-binding cassette, subfamily B, bacterial
MKGFKLLFTFLKGSRILYILAILLCLASVWVSLFVPLVVKVIVDSIIGSQPINETGLLAWIFSFKRESFMYNITFFCLAGVAFTLVASVFQYVYSVLVTIVSHRVGKKMRDDLYSHIQRLEYEYHSKAETGDLIQRCTTDVENSMTFIAEHFINIVRVVFMLITTVALMLGLNVTMSLISMGLVPVIFVYSLLFFKRIQKAFEAQEETDSMLNGALQENLTGVRVVKAFARQDYEIHKFDEINKANRGKHMDIIKAMSQFWSTSDGMSLVQIFMVLVVGSYFVVSGVFGLGVIIAFFSYVEKLMWPVKQLGRLLAESGRTAVSLKRISEIFNTEPEVIKEGKGNTRGYRRDRIYKCIL